jgi:hypothetical protein
MNKKERVRAFAIAAVALPGLLLSAAIASANGNGVGRSLTNANPAPLTGSVPRADCGPSDRTEAGLQGQVTPEERSSGDSALGYNCNLELVGQYRGEGAYSQGGPAFFGDCAYMTTDHITPLQQHHGVTVIDASDPRHPQPTAYLDDTPAMLAPHETLKVNAGRKIMAAGQNNGSNFAVYDLSGDCRHPVRMSSIDLPGSKGHMGNFAPDGRTYYLTQSFRGVGGKLYVVDLDDPANPKELPPWTFQGDGRPHEAWLNAAGTRLYAGQPGLFGAAPTDSSFGPDGLVIDDVSDYQFRLPNPQIRIVSKLFWDDQGQAEPMYPVTVNGHPYIISGDEDGGQGGAGGLPAACARGASHSGYSNIIDISDETHPKIVATIMLEVNDPANCSRMLNDPPDVGGEIPTYSPERCTADRQTNPTMLACGLWAAGVRVFDIRDILHPKEIAYYKPPAPGTAFLPSSGTWAPGIDSTFDKVAGYMSFHEVPRANGHANEHGNARSARDVELWFVSDGNGFQVLRFTDRFKALHKDLFEDLGQ